MPCDQITKVSSTYLKKPEGFSVVYRKGDVSLGRRVYRKATHAGLYLHAQSHPSQPRSVLTTLVYGAQTIADNYSISNELKYLERVFKENGYNPYDLHWPMNKTYEHDVN